MIRNEREYRITKTQAEKFQTSIERAEATKPPPRVHPKLHQASIDAMKAERAKLLEELAAYDELQASGGKRFRGAYRDLPTLLIQARIARGWSQRELAERLGLQMQKVQQYEATEYAGASVTRIGEIVTALGLQLELRGQLADLVDRSEFAAPALREKPAVAARGSRAKGKQKAARG